MKIIEILRLTDLGYGQRDIGKSVGHGKSTVGEVQKRCREAGMTFEKAKTMTNTELQQLLYPDYMGKRYIKPDPDFEYIYNELVKHPNLNMRFLWEEYKIQDQNGLEYSQFCNRFISWKNESGKKVSMHQERDPGKELFVDWMGDKLSAVVDPTTGEVYDAHLFVAVLGNSGMPYVEAFPDEKIDKWLVAHRHAFEFYNGVPKILVPDNCKTATTKSHKYEPVLNQAYRELAEHYNVAVIPARVRKPQDKCLVEESIGWLETWLLGKLRKQTFFNFEELNSAIKTYMNELCHRSFQKREGSRMSVFKELDQPSLGSLPLVAYECWDALRRTVPDNYHVEYEGFYYSVPYTLYTKKVLVRATAKIIEVFDDNRLRVASHIRKYSGKRYVTDDEHMPENHRKYWEAKQFTGDRYLMWASNIGTNTHDVISTLLTSVKVEEQAYKGCMGILQFSKKYSPDRLEMACLKAKELNSCSYSTISNILKNGQDMTAASSTSKPTPIHENIRGSAYYG